MSLNYLFGSYQFAQGYLYHMTMNLEYPANAFHTARLVADVVNAEFLPKITTDLLYDFTEEDRLGDIDKNNGNQSIIS